MKELNHYLTESYNFSRDEVELITSHSESMSLKKGEYFLKSGEYCKSVAFVISGTVIYYENSDGDERVCDFAFENDWISQLTSLLNNIPSKMNIKVIEDTQLVVLSKQDFDFLKTELIKFNLLVTEVSQNLVIKANNRIANFAHLSAKKRYHKEIEENPKLLQRIPQYYLASYLGIKPQSLSRIRSV
ncbi:cAMP-binding domain of CRP or a regulatory subunit of cAMP-dependent protein kinases [Tenacibaculum sp. MAR_2009_124]|uniref:Crp/Fnr family transcriptional regulator n=1 Tax=Tenacibaculum sp. MAR_2009_124 TaxID=1250059 RepID=UPI000898183A|nr:Crp/Fnr family transcriptional regulator [Tenacibaculum sp. MAR_2009_124]SED06478.1 cAMP-binding domain of CRP or a regulatory subunit of cAMP-dependent protein kinases [Tenacibaculum sp. MAR_2009_124]